MNKDIFSNWPCLTRNLPGIGGEIKLLCEDFRVDELPAYQPCGEGTHVFIRVEKRGMTTAAAASRIAKFLDVHPDEVGYAGMKDSRAVTTQYFSIEHIDGNKLSDYDDGQLKVLSVSKHGNKLKTGHLIGNRFVIRIRGVGEVQLANARAVFDVLCRRGVPNYFGVQRFGARCDNHLLGEALVRDDRDKYLKIFLGCPQAGDTGDTRAARDSYDVSCVDRALKLWPRQFEDQRKALLMLRKTGRPGPAIGAIDRRIKRLHISAFQSAVFNDILAQRIDRLDTLLVGDMACKADTGGVFYVEDIAAEQPRADKGEISPTGMVAGYRSNFAQGEQGDIEHEVLTRHGVELDMFKNLGALKAKGTRRILRYFLHEPAISCGRDENGTFIEVRFCAPSGCYATSLLREIMKVDVDGE